MGEKVGKAPIVETRTRKKIAFSGETIWALNVERRGGVIIRPNEDRSPMHHIPETPEELEQAQEYTKALRELMQHNVLGNRLARNLLNIATGMVLEGKISEREYLSIHEAYSSALGIDTYLPLDAPTRYIEVYGSIYRAGQPTG